MKNNDEISLFINTATYSIQLAVCFNDNTYIVEEKDPKLVLEKCNILINQACNKASITLRDVNSFYTLLGPGSNTGIRLGLTVPKTIYALNPSVKLYGINTLQLFSFSKGCPILSDRNSSLYTLNEDEIIKINKNDIDSLIQSNDCFIIDRYDSKATDILKGAKKIKRIDVIKTMIEFKDKFTDFSSNDEKYLPIYQQIL